MFRKKRVKEAPSDESKTLNQDTQLLILEALRSLYSEGIILNDAFVLEADDIYIYVDLISIENNVAQIAFQVHHEWLDDAIIESVVASGSDVNDAIDNACMSFSKHVLDLIIEGIHHPKSCDVVEGVTQERHYFYIYRSEVFGIGKREGIVNKDFWDMIHTSLIDRLGNRKTYWIKIFTSKEKNKVVCEARINHIKDTEITKTLVSYAENWDCLSDYYTEKQCFLLVQDDMSYVNFNHSVEEIADLTMKAIKQFEHCDSKEYIQRLKKQLEHQCHDVSLVYEIVGLIPEILSKLWYPDVEFGDYIYLIKKGKTTRELFQSQLHSYAIIEQTLIAYLEDETTKKEAVQHILRYSAIAKAINEAVLDGEAMNSLYIAGIGYIVPENYQFQ